MSFLKSLGRALLIGAIAATGIGLFYLYAKFHIIKQGERGISYNGDSLVVLPPGPRFLLSPLHVLSRTIPVDSDQVVTLSEFEARSQDNLPLLVQANFTYRIESNRQNVENAILRVTDYEKALQEAVRNQIVTTLQERDCHSLTSGLETFGAKEEKEDKESCSQPPESRTNKSSIKMRGTSSSTVVMLTTSSKKPSLYEQIKKSLETTCNGWGITLTTLRLTKVEAKNRNLTQEAAEISHSLLTAKARGQVARVEARTEAEVQVILAEGAANAMTVMAAGKVKAIKFIANELKTENERQIFDMHAYLEALRGTPHPIFSTSMPSYACHGNHTSPPPSVPVKLSSNPNK